MIAKQEVEILVATNATSTFLSIEDLAVMLKVSPRTLRRRQRDGLMPPRLKRTRKFEYRSHEVAEWLAGKVQRND
ncbi:helix-turn-helix domain-containing protein [Aurantimonas sp. C2-6-R+9]|uniref:helix-turn-helix domain-containing protein n=1 Tax=unclassified Aurantimonas TaxID=2638230 RepID=UPI002E187761|nr:MULTISPECIES: helix-turn-helix domain-containing protein [unclassified Aurantimonas]MEC5293226.1 helix-turn-helix domain-containing protein [Aurantimonas sp. C2-3-R2]MEC5383649.1 helix-turn-helix domain-containing protein [Aurantimonas sp. C2-6-R+9]MEC5414325.1 helix-turn-helix domain-containing protein [Aurantimonas sp. C2-4-R8]